MGGTRTPRRGPAGRTRIRGAGCRRRSAERSSDHLGRLGGALQPAAHRSGWSFRAAVQRGARTGRGRLRQGGARRPQGRGPAVSRRAQAGGQGEALGEYVLQPRGGDAAVGHGEPRGLGALLWRVRAAGPDGAGDRGLRGRLPPRPAARQPDALHRGARQIHRVAALRGCDPPARAGHRAPRPEARQRSRDRRQPAPQGAHQAMRLWAGGRLRPVRQAGPPLHAAHRHARVCAELAPT